MQKVTVPENRPAIAVDLSDPHSFAAAVPHAWFDLLRATEPVSWNPVDCGAPRGGFWSLTRHAEVAAVSRDQRNFTSTMGVMYPSFVETVIPVRNGMILCDPPEHTRLRALITASFSRVGVARLEGQVRGLVAQILQDVAALDRFDFVKDVATVLPTRVVAALLGVPEPDIPLIKGWAEAVVFSQPENNVAHPGAKAVSEALEYVAELRQYKRRHPGEDVMTALGTAEISGRQLSESEYSVYFLLLVSAGFESTHTLLGQSMRLILEDPAVEQQVHAAAQAGRMSGVVEELLRHISPVMHMARHAKHDVTLGEKLILAGDMVVLWYVAANRDPEIFEDPHNFDGNRSTAHVSFGAGGPHFCVGSHLARLEARVLLEELFTQGPRLELAGTPQRGWSVFANHLRALPVAVRRTPPEVTSD